MTARPRRPLATVLAAVLVAALLAGGLTVATPTAAAAACVTNPATPKRQFRAMWIASVVNLDWPTTGSFTAPDRIAAQKAEYLGWLDLAQRLRHNAVVVQVRPSADAFWPSPHEPWSQFLTGVRGQDPGWDPLAFLVAEAHKRNLEFHAWMNPYRVSMPAPGGAGADKTKLPLNHPARVNPDWAVAYPVGTTDSQLYYNPGIPAVRAFVQTAMLDAVKRYDIDGVHFDDYFYPYPKANQDFPDNAAYTTYRGTFTNKADWRRNNIDLLVQEFGQKVKAAKPWVKFGISPFGIWRNKSTSTLGSDTNGLQSYDAIYADTRKWVKQQWIDYIVPQVYWHIGNAAADYAKLVPWWSGVVSGTRVQLYIGQADYKIGDPPAQWQDPAEMGRHLTLNRQYPQVAGNIHYRAWFLRANRLNAITLYTAQHYSRPALVPPMTFLPAASLARPVPGRGTRTTRGVQITWQGGSAATSYAVYRFDGWRVPMACDFADASRLIGTVRGAQSYLDTTAVRGRPYTYAISALDRQWNESQPSRPLLVR